MNLKITIEKLQNPRGELPFPDNKSTSSCLFPSICENGVQVL